MIRKYRGRKPLKIYEMHRMYIQLSKELESKEDGVFIYDVITLPWRSEFEIQEKLDEDGDIIQDKYIEEFFDELFTEGKCKESGR